jgi:hypothetical protein
MFKFFSGITIFIIACLLQFSLAPAGVTVDFIFAALIAFSFIFSFRAGEFWELILFILAGVFVTNWIPAPSIALVAFVAIPIFTGVFSAVFSWEAWTGVVISLVLGFVVLYLVAAPQFIFAATPSFLIDLFTGSAFGMVVFLYMDRVFG